MLKALLKNLRTKPTVLERAEIEKYHRDGILVFDTGIPHMTLDAVVADLTMAKARRAKSQATGSAYFDANRFQDAWSFSTNVKALATWPRVLEVLAALYDRKPLPFQTLNFPAGTEQRAHSDTIHFNCEPFGLMCGVWIALEDIGPDQGPLIYYPGSNGLPEMNFEDFGLKPSYSEYVKYEDHLEHLIQEQGFQPSYGIIKKGQAIIWSANLLHGGSKQNNKNLSRHSQVSHYFFEGARPWRPGHSAKQRAYFKPNWIPVDDKASRSGG